ARPRLRRRGEDKVVRGLVSGGAGKTRSCAALSWSCASCLRRRASLSWSCAFLSPATRGRQGRARPCLGRARACLRLPGRVRLVEPSGERQGVPDQPRSSCRHGLRRARRRGARSRSVRRRDGVFTEIWITAWTTDAKTPIG